MYEEKNKGDVLFYEGDSGKKFFILIEGEVEFLKEIKKKQKRKKI